MLDGKRKFKAEENHKNRKELAQTFFSGGDKELILRELVKSG